MREPGAARAGRRPRLNQPWRGFVAFGEVLLATAAVIVGVLAWRHGIATMVTPITGRPALVSTIFHGSWQSSAIGLVTIAALLVLDAIRQAALAIGTRQRSAFAPAAEPRDDEQTL
jgi:hypothetical protein